MRKKGNNEHDFFNSMLTVKIIKNFQSAARKMHKHEKRLFQAEICKDYLGGSARKAERVFHWWRESVELGLNELRTGIICLGNYSKRGRKKTEEKYEDLEKDIAELIEGDIHADPKLETTFQYCKISANAVSRKLEEEKGYEKGVFQERTMSKVLNRLGYRLKKL